MRGLPTSARRAALQLEGHINIHDDFVDFIVAILKTAILSVMNHGTFRYFLRKSGSEMTGTAGVNGDYYTRRDDLRSCAHAG